MVRYVKKIILVAAVLVALVAFFATAVSAEDPSVGGACGADLTWSLNLRTGKLEIDGTGAMWLYSQPSEDGAGAPWYAYRDSVRSVTVGDGVTTVSAYAFYGCESVLSVRLGGSVLQIGEYAFYDCPSLAQIHLPATLEKVGVDAFSEMEAPHVYITDLAAWCVVDFADYTSNPLFCKGVLYLNGEKLVDAVIPDGVPHIGNFAFIACDGLASVTVPDSVTDIGIEAFANCRDLLSVRLSENLTHLGTSAFFNCSRLTSVILPESLEQIQLTTFSWCSSLTSVAFPDGLREIGAYAFASCFSLTSVILPEGIEHVDFNAFYDCPKLTDLICLSEDAVFFDGVNTVAKDATIHGYVGSPAQTYAERYGRTFESVDSYIVGGFCGAEGGNVTWALYEGGHLVLSGTGKMDTYLYSSNVPWHAFRRFIRSVTVKTGVTSVSAHAFEYCSKLAAVELPDGVTEIGDYAFEYCVSLVDLSLPDSLRSVGDYAFSNCERLTDIAVPRGVSSVGKYAFANCTDLVRVAVPVGVRKIGEGAFSDCPNLTDITVDAGNTTYRNIGNCAVDIRNQTLIAGSKESDIPADGSVTVIGDLAFSGRAGLTRVVIPDEVTHVGNSAFRACLDLESVTVGRNVTAIGQFAFYECDTLSQLIVLSKTVVFCDAVHTVPQSTVIYGYSGSTAQAYAEKYGITFITIGNDPDKAGNMHATLADAEQEEDSRVSEAASGGWLGVKRFFSQLWDKLLHLFK